jgi:hypothetical protein
MFPFPTQGTAFTAITLFLRSFPMRRMLSRILGSKKNTNRRARPRKASLRVEALEQRDLMTVTAATLTDGVLRVTCNTEVDNVEIRETTPAIVILLANPGAGPAAQLGTITVKDNTWSPVRTFPFNRPEVQRIEVDMGGGGGQLVSDASVPTLVVTGDGINSVETGPANDTIICGSGKDTVRAGAGDDLIIGGSGQDSLLGQAGKDTIIGGTGGGIFYGGDGDDTIKSTNHHDFVDGGNGYDHLFLQAILSTSQNAEDVTIAVDGDQPQTDGFSCGPNSGARFLRSYGIDVSYDTLRSKVKAESFLFRIHMGTRPSVLLKVLRKFKSDLDMDTNASLQDVLVFLRSGKPVVALVAPKSRSLHYVVLNGFDLDSETIRYVDTNGVKGSWSFDEFVHRWEWTNYFTGFRGRIMRLGLKIAGLRNRTYIA